MIQEEELLREAEKAGFDHYKILSARKVQFEPFPQKILRG